MGEVEGGGERGRGEGARKSQKKIESAALIT